MSSGDQTLHDVLREARGQLVAAGLAESASAIDVDVLARHLLGWDRATLLVRRRDPAPDGFAASLAPLVARRATREPVGYITGHREFWGLEFAVTRDVLIPRPESEIVVDEAIAALGASGRSSTAHGPRVLDIGTGSGCLAIAIARSVDAAVVFATDVSLGALRVARDNARRLGARVTFAASDLFQPLRTTSPWVDVLVSNPPYVPRGARNVMLDVARHEPEVALYGGPDGLAYVRRLVSEAALVVYPGGSLVFEFGDGQEDVVRQILLDASDAWSLVRIRDDLQGIARVVVAERRG